MARYDPVDSERYWREQNPRRQALRDRLDARRLPYGVAMWNLSKDWNLGNLIRTANAFLCGEIILIGSANFDETGSAGIHRFERMRHFSTADPFLAYAHENGYGIVAVEIDARAEWLPGFRYPARPLFLFGNELEGLPEALVTRADHRVMIPQYGLIPCLNVSVTCSIVLYDYLTRTHPGLDPAPVDGAKFKLDPGSGQRPS
jgi:tRNA G18 (ribose-2'-O)-methylase SpoU